MRSLAELIIETLAAERGYSSDPYLNLEMTIIRATQVIHRANMPSLIKSIFIDEFKILDLTIVKRKLLSLLLWNIDKVLIHYPTQITEPHIDGRMPIQILQPYNQRPTRMAVIITCKLFKLSQDKIYEQHLIKWSRAADFTIPRNPDDKDEGVTLLSKLLTTDLPLRCLCEFSIAVLRRSSASNLLDAQLLIAGRSLAELDLRLDDEIKLGNFVSAGDRYSLGAMHILLTKYGLQLSVAMQKQLKITVNTLLIDRVADAEALFIAGNLYNHALLGESNKLMAQRLYQKAVDLDHQQATVSLAMMFDDGEIGLLPSGEPNVYEAKRLYLIASANFNDPVAQAKLKKLYVELLNSPNPLRYRL